jgi:hypothetical protein
MFEDVIRSISPCGETLARSPSNVTEERVGRDRLPQNLTRETMTRIFETGQSLPSIEPKLTSYCLNGFSHNHLLSGFSKRPWRSLRKGVYGGDLIQKKKKKKE